MSYPYDKAVMQKGKAWGKMPVPSLWENNVLPGFDGIVVMQFELDLPAIHSPSRLYLVPSTTAQEDFHIPPPPALSITSTVMTFLPPFTRFPSTR